MTKPNKKNITLVSDEWEDLGKQWKRTQIYNKNMGTSVWTKEQQKEIDEIKADIKELKSDVSELKHDMKRVISMLEQIISCPTIQKEIKQKA